MTGVLKRRILTEHTGSGPAPPRSSSTQDSTHPRHMNIRRHESARGSCMARCRQTCHIFRMSPKRKDAARWKGRRMRCGDRRRAQTMRSPRRGGGIDYEARPGAARALAATRGLNSRSSVQGLLLTTS
eukprot:scaffold189005_cov30-Tisochrysis_lutea.AAC.4